MIRLSIAEAKSACSYVGFVLKKENGEFEVYPRGKRGAQSYFTSDIEDAVLTAKATSATLFAEVLANLEGVSEETIEALAKWQESEGCQWKDALYTAWHNGNYRSFRNTNVESTLQRFRNTNGYEVLAKL